MQDGRSLARTLLNGHSIRNEMRTMAAFFTSGFSITSSTQEDLGGDGDGGGASTVPQTGYLELKDSAGHAEMAVLSAEEVGGAMLPLLDTL